MTVGHVMPMGGAMLIAQPMAIRWSSIQAWCDRAGCDESERQDFIMPLVRVLDREFLAHWARQQRRVDQGQDDKVARWHAME